MIERGLIQEAEFLTDAIQKDFDAYFNFKIGDIVICKDYLASLKMEAAINGSCLIHQRVTIPVGMTILQRNIEQCHGGFQGFYTVRRWSVDSDGRAQEMAAKFIEHELAPWSEIEAPLRAQAPEKKS